MGTWLTKDAACSCMQASGLNTAECGASDCVEANGLILRPDGTSSDFILRRSASRSSASVVGGKAGVISGAWDVSPELELVQTFGSRTFATGLSCGDESLVRVAKSTYVKPAPEVAKALEAASHTDWAPVVMHR